MKPEYPEKPTDQPQVTDKLYHIVSSTPSSKYTCKSTIYIIHIWQQVWNVYFSKELKFVIKRHRPKSCAYKEKRMKSIVEIILDATKEYDLDHVLFKFAIQAGLSYMLASAAAYGPLSKFI